MKRTPLKRKPYKLKRSPLKRKPTTLKRRKKLNRKSKTPMAKLEDKLWILFSLYIRRRDGWRCITCGKVPENRQQLHAGHWISRRSKSVKFDPHNVHGQCASCNMFLKGNVAVYSAEIIKKYGIEEFYRILGDARFIKQWTEKEFLILIEVLQKDPAMYELAYYKIQNGNKES